MLLYYYFFLSHWKVICSTDMWCTDDSCTFGGISSVTLYGRSVEIAL